jgi:hypothetical protein
MSSPLYVSNHNSRMICFGSGKASCQRAAGECIELQYHSTYLVDFLFETREMQWISVRIFPDQPDSILHNLP